VDCGLLQHPGETCPGCNSSIAKLKSPFDGFRFHDLRHQAITELASPRQRSSDHVYRIRLEHPPRLSVFGGLNTSVDLHVIERPLVCDSQS